MMEPRLRTEIAAVELTLRRTQLWRELTTGWLAAAAAALLLLLLQRLTGWISPIQWLIPSLVGLIVAGIAWRRHEYCQPDWRAAVSALEREHPELRHLLSAAAEQEPDPDAGGFKYLQLRVIEEVLQHPHRPSWKQSLERKLAGAKNAHLAAAGGFLIVLLALGYGSTRAHPAVASWHARDVDVTPGDTEVERGTGLVISARFGGEPPAEATLVLATASGKTKRIPLERHLADPVFGASLLEVTEAGLYHIEYGDQRTRDFKLAVFDFPALVRADALLRFPNYTGLTNKTIPDTLRISAVEGTRLTYTLQLNKPVVRARFVSREQSLTLNLQSNSALLKDLPLTNSARYSLALEDAEGRTNKFPNDFVLQVLTNQRPELRLVFPLGDQRVSRLEEVQLQGEATDDFGLLKYGVGFTVAGKDPQLIELGQTVPARQKRQFNYLIPLENLAVDVDQVIAYFVWADDYGPDGKVRRTFGDMFFAEVRPFEEIFRPDQSGMAGNESGSQGQSQGNEGANLAELQKEIVIATWKLQKEKSTAAYTKTP